MTDSHTDYKTNHSIALVHDWLHVLGGAERVLIALRKLYPQAPIYTLLYEPTQLQNFFADANVHPSFLQKFPAFLRKRHKFLLPLIPSAVEAWDLKEYDLVISDSSSFAKGVIVQPETIHVSYCHTPMRFAWDWSQEYMSEQKLRGVEKPFAYAAMNVMRLWDRLAADRVDYFVANSRTTAKRIKTYYHRDSKVIYPPVDVDSFQVGKERRGYFLLVSRLSAYKRVDIAIKAFNKLKLPLLVIGQGEAFAYLQSIAGPTVKLLGFQPDAEVKKYMASCEAFIFPTEDDFGISAVEAMASGKPVLALRKGGATETMIEGVTGEFFDDPHEELLADGIRRLRNARNTYDPEKIRDHAQQFSRQRFEKEFDQYIASLLP